MEFNQSIINQLLDYFKCNSAKEVQQVYNGKDAYRLTLNKKDDELTLTIKKIENNDRKELEAFMENIDDELWVRTMENFEQLTGHTVKEMDNLWENGKFKEVLNLLKPAIKATAEEQVKEHNSAIAELVSRYGLNRR